MSYVVRKIGGGSFNPKAMCVSNDNTHLFIGCGCQINVYHIPDLELLETCVTHTAHITALACTDEELISADRSGRICWHKLTPTTIMENKPYREIFSEFPVERLIVRNKQIFYVYYHKKLFWAVGLDDAESIFMIDNQTQQKLIENMHESVILQGMQPLRFTMLDGFDINEDATTVAVVDKCKLHIFNISTGKHEIHPTQTPIAYVRFRDNNQVVTFLSNGQMFIYGGKGKTPVRDHWHFACPNAFDTTDSSVVSGGFEGVLTFYNEIRHCHEHVPRLGLSIEGIALTHDKRYVCVQFDKNMIGVVDASASNHSVIATRSLITGDVHFTDGKLVSVRQPNLVQVFDCKTSNVIKQLQVSSFHSNVPLTSCELGDEYMITVETSGIKEDPKLTISGKVSMVHKKPHANKQAHDVAYKKVLLKDKYSQMKAIKKIVYGIDEEEGTIVDDGTAERVGNSLMKDPDATTSVDYSEIKIWHIVNNKYQLEQSFRCIGKTAKPLSIHPTLNVFAVVISHDLQIWKRSDSEMWEMWRSSHLPIIPQKLNWSNDGTILIAQYNKRIDLMDAETLTVAASHQLESTVQVAKFISDCEIAIQTKLGFHIFDIRTLTETKVIFAQASCGDVAENAFVFVLNKEQPVVVLYDNGDMKSWQVPALAPIKDVHIMRNNGRCVITAVDEDNFLWGIDEFGFEEKKPVIKLAISTPKPKPIKKLERTVLSKDHVAELVELFKVSSHQIYDGLEVAFFDTVLESRTRQEAATIPVKIDDDIDDSVKIRASKYTPAEMNEMREAFNF